MTPPAKPMKTEAKKTFRSGFALTEGELRRLHDILAQQMKRTPIAEGFQASYELKFRNGSVSYPASLEEVLAQENFGSASILRFKMSVYDTADKPSNQINVEFINADEAEGSSLESIRYSVLGDDRDWVFITSSQLDERISKIRLFVPNQLFGNRRTPFWAFAPLLLGMFAAAAVLVPATVREHHQAVNQLDAIERSWQTGALKDPVEAVIKVGQIVVDRSEPPLTSTWGLTLAIIAIPLGLVAVGYCYVYFQPPYNFLWGDYVGIYNKRRSRGRLLLVGVLLALIVGVIVNLISKKIGL